jgi:dTDP-4-dehydrorhamnose reductase
MRLVIAGGHGQIAVQLERMLAARGETPGGIARNRVHVADLEQVGAVVR